MRYHGQVIAPTKLAFLRRTLSLVVAGALIAAALIAVKPAPAAASGAEGEGWPIFTESDGCMGPRVRAPRVNRMGSLSSTTAIRGPWGDYFGRTAGAVGNETTWWTVPMSDGERLRVHKRTLPALLEVGAALQAHQAAGRNYLIRKAYTFAYSSRTIGGSTKVSHHAIGNAIDVNSIYNPYSEANVLKTNMPSWFVQTWRDAGFCWGGDWFDKKDTMHYSWNGPAFTDGVAPGKIYAPLSAEGDFGAVYVSKQTPGALQEDTVRILSELDGDAVIDVGLLTERNGNVIVDVSQARGEHESCAVWRYVLPGETLADTTVVYGDYDGRGGTDLWLMTDQDGAAHFEIYDRWTNFEEHTTLQTSVPLLEGDAYFTGDHGNDGTVDLYVIRRSAGSTSLEIWSNASGFDSKVLDVDTGLGDTTGWQFTLADRNLDQIPDLVAVDPAGTMKILLGSGYDTVSETRSIPNLGDVLDVTAGDYDGDGRDDLQVLRSDGRKIVLLGNRVIYSDAEQWFRDPDTDCDSGDLPYPYTGQFRDDDDNIHEANIERIFELGTTRGCNPPLADRYCPDRAITRGEMAAFLVRTIGLTDTGGKDWFADDDESMFEDDINKIAAAGITSGCAPDRFCPDRELTREQMAAFIARAFGFEDGGDGSRFVDDDDSMFEAEIEALAAVGVTLGCNPPDNDRFCPLDILRRDQMASFIARAVAVDSA
jgi:D-alanyl-D-alanine carboxypeptidase/S-layer homology domain